MIDQQINQTGSLKSLCACVARLNKGLSESTSLNWFLTGLTNWRLTPFLFRRADVGLRCWQGSLKLIFYGNRLVHAQNERAYSARLGSHATWQLIKFATLPVIFTILALIFLIGFPAVYHKFSIGKGWPTILFPAVVTESYVGLMTTIAQAAAAMLALFFTAVSVVASTAYAKVTTQIRLLIAQDDLNRRYLRLLAHTAATAMAGIALHAGGVPASNLLATYILVLSVVCLLAFLPLGIRTFALFDPSNLTAFPVRAFVRATATVTRTGWRWLHPSFQSHANRVAETQLRLLSDLLTFGIAENRPRHDTVLDIAKAVNVLARIYVAKKTEIPSDSFWFTRKSEFKRWELTSGSMASVVLRSGVTPAPDPVPNHSFVETQCTEITVRCLQYLLTRHAIDDVVVLLLEVSETVVAYAQQFEQQESMRLVSIVRNTVFGHLKTIDATIEPLKHLQIVDLLGMAALAPILTAGLSLTEKSTVEMLQIDVALLNLNRRALYVEPHPRRVLKNIEDLFHRLYFERAAEGVIRTQPWYVRQLIAFAYADVIRETIQFIVETVSTEFVSPAADLVAAKRALCAGVLLQRAVEACHKANVRIGHLNTKYTELEQYRITNLQWHPSGAEAALAAIEAKRVGVMKLLAEIVPELCAIPPGMELPDFLGQVRAWLAQELVTAMERKQEEGFTELFIGYFNASFSIQRHFIEFAEQPDKQDYVRVAMDAALDIMDMSGLALLFSEMDGTRFGKIVAAAWNRYFEQAENKQAIVRALYAAIDSKLMLPVFSSSAMQRHEWGHRFAKAMVDRGIQVDRQFDNLWEEAEPAQPHASPVIESILVSYGHPMGDPHEYFGALYIASRDDANGIEVPPSVNERIESIDRARVRLAEFKR